MKFLSNVFVFLAIILSYVMCAVVAYKYCELSIGAQYTGASAPPHLAFLWIIPYAVGIVICLVVAFVLRRKWKNKRKAA
ncbi:MAG: hypothetical protein PHO46_01050 [Thermoguttaceae bacterium]|nr:hypothetical protein [Thermoguttaceae bacterium]